MLAVLPYAGLYDSRYTRRHWWMYVCVCICMCEGVCEWMLLYCSSHDFTRSHTTNALTRNHTKLLLMSRPRCMRLFAEADNSRHNGTLLPEPKNSHSCLRFSLYKLGPLWKHCLPLVPAEKLCIHLLIQYAHSAWVEQFQLYSPKLTHPTLLYVAVHLQKQKEKYGNWLIAYRICGAQCSLDCCDYAQLTKMCRTAKRHIMYTNAPWLQ